MYSGLVQLLLREQKIGYVITDLHFTVLIYEGEPTLFNEVAHTSVHLLDLIPELVGCEDLLQEVLVGTLPRFELENINRFDSEEVIHYLTVTALSATLGDKENQQSVLFVMLTDTSEWAQAQQTLTQQRNELTLLKQNLAEVNQRLEFLLQHYVPREVGAALMEQRILPELGGEVREITVLFADLRGYTSISEKQTPTETVEMLQICMDIASTAIAEAGGVVVNYMGDGIMAIFNAPDQQPNHAQRAIRAGLTLHNIATVYQTCEKVSENPLYFGIGINTGMALVGNLGAQWYYQYTAVGDIVNVASRICSHAQPGEVLIGAETYVQAKEVVIAHALPPTKFKGKSQELTIYHVTQLIDDEDPLEFNIPCN